MKKTFMTSIIALAFIFAVPVSAQKSDNTSGAAKVEHSKKDIKNRKARHQRINAFEGIELTDAQKEAIKSLTPKRHECTSKDSLNCKNSDDKQRRGHANSAMRRNGAKKIRTAYVNGVKEILSPDQYVVFLENIVVKGARIPGEKKGMYTHKNFKRKHMKEGKANRHQIQKRFTHKNTEGKEA